ncbi:MAG: glycerophosphodiester phosphodiesterase [Lentisphaerae bacterium]|jgi:glycerophosphoryl diester phosphodiesterase|nr:glycerophosphodiester phosphodiesterase [Lentisphaerota bacterium]
MLKPIIEAHRGYSAQYPENTLCAFRQAIAVGAPSIELDVHASADGEIVVMHDASVDRTSNGKGAIAQMKLAELKKLDVGAWKGPEFAGERIPTLGEALALSDTSNVAFNVEIKAFSSTKVVERLVALLHEHAPRGGSHVVSSFDVNALLQVRAVDSGVPLCILGGNAAKILHQAEEMDFPWIHSHFSTVNGDVVAAAHAQGRRVMIWTMDKPALFQHYVRLGVDKVCTNCPAEMLAAQ